MSEKFDPSEFTEEFDLERFRAGEPALMSCSEFAKFVREDDGIIRTNRGVFIDVAMFADGESCANKWRMRPAQDGWHPVINAMMPIAGGIGELQFKLSDGRIIANLFNYRVDDIVNGTVAVRRVPAQPSNTISEDSQIHTDHPGCSASVIPLEGLGQLEKIKREIDGIDADIREIFDISTIIGQAFFDARTGKRTIGPVVECPVIARLMR